MRDPNSKCHKSQEEVAAMEVEVQRTRGLRNELNSTLLHELEATKKAFGDQHPRF